jgi:hypothetical protein
VHIDLDEDFSAEADAEAEAAVEEGARELRELHEAVGMIVADEEALLDAHMAAIQENAQVGHWTELLTVVLQLVVSYLQLLTEEGALLSQVQGSGVVDYDIDAYAAKLHDVLSRKLATTQALLHQLNVFRRHLLAEEQTSQRIDPSKIARLL